MHTPPVAGSILQGKDMTKRIYVGNLSTQTTERELAGLFERVGRVVSARIMMDRETSRPKGFGFVEMDSEDADRAIAQFNQTDLNGRLLSVTEARARPQSSPNGGAPASRLFVGNLPYEATAAELKDLFSSVGMVSNVSLPVERESGKPRGFAFVEFPDPAHAQEAVRRFHDQPFNGRPLVVNEARARESRPSSSSFSPRPSQSQTTRPSSCPFPQDDQFSRKGGPSRHFGPDATPQRGRKQPSRGPKSERGHKKPMGERKGGQFFGTIDDEPYDDPFLEDQLTNQMNDSESDEQP
jgi:RNA recognition motif-containing protein